MLTEQLWAGDDHTWRAGHINTCFAGHSNILGGLVIAIPGGLAIARSGGLAIARPVQTANHVIVIGGHVRDYEQLVKSGFGLTCQTMLVMAVPV